MSTNEEGQYVVHVDTVIGSQDGDNAPTITNSQDDFVIPIGILSMHSLSAYTVHAIHFHARLWPESFLIFVLLLGFLNEIRFQISGYRDGVR